ncbi:hypothetical protein KAFR_0H02550 [Kazachstania africana CBS 2517]|uniref:Uncharacterized protein n=1 Tax=Kazachstania africana (strain ATCC 22294 / BCRC 22015 / CBS 2517 / CECT 1963 / NBRC 1671 / NRRL Y-8276) TaxID=1071382 RepID=H2AZA8_KAZAF|nr:hypothetical protein KAFR_0H02550 [Kazachstania africana CBS 2517]CCF59664.1 hypothetical protein KAFR_0H02550 [Kazachstania africana CBS 2517]
MCYQHISTFRPSLLTFKKPFNDSSKAIVFTDRCIPNLSNGTLTTSILYSINNHVYELETVLPLGAHYSRDDTIPVPDYNEYTNKVRANEVSLIKGEWTYTGNAKIIKLVPLRDSEFRFLALSSNGSIAWFKDDVSLPVSTYDEESIDSGIVVDITVSYDGKRIAKAYSDSKKGQHVTVMDNNSKAGEIIHKFKVASNAGVIKSVAFINENIVATASDDNILRFWDLKGESFLTPKWTLDFNSNDSNLECIDSSPFADTLFATGDSRGNIKIWDLRTITSNEEIQEGSDGSIFTLEQHNNEGLSSIKFSKCSPSELITMSNSGNICHWDLTYLFKKGGSSEEGGTEDTNEFKEEIQNECLTFYHTGGSRRSPVNPKAKNTVDYHPFIEDLVSTIDNDGLITIYKPFTVPQEDSEEEEKEATNNEEEGAQKED